jgi:hypothetical protein
MPETPTNKITVIDSIMGSGKTTWLIDRLKAAKSTKHAHITGDADPRRYMVLTPLIDQTKRIQAECPEADLRDPRSDVGNKTKHLQMLLEENHNIVTTHSLFRMMSQETYALISKRRYSLIIDEALSCFDLYDEISPSDVAILFREKMVVEEEGTGKLRWNHGDHGDYRGEFDYVRTFCDNGNLVVYKPGNGDRKVLLWELPAEFLRCFESVTIMTYLFAGSPLSAFLRSEGFIFDMMAVNKGKLVAHRAVDDAEIKAKLRTLVTIYEGKANNIGKKAGKENPLSSSWFRRADRAAHKALKASTVNFFRYAAKTPSKLNMWSTFKKYRPHLAGEGYARGFVSINAKATNEYIEKRSLAYLANVFHHPDIKGFFRQKGLDLDDDLHALSEMIQWIWRSQIRRGDPITVYVPSERMRALLLDWLSGAAATKHEKPLGERLAQAMSLEAA